MELEQGSCGGKKRHGRRTSVCSHGGTAAVCSEQLLVLPCVILLYGVGSSAVPGLAPALPGSPVVGELLPALIVLLLQHQLF